MDGKHPKRRKDKYNPYSISEKDGHFFLAFKDGQDVSHSFEIDRPLYNLLNSFELDDLSYLNVVDRHIEQSELTEATLHRRTFQEQEPLEETVIHNVQTELLHKLIAELPETQQRRLCLYYFGKLTYEQIAGIEGCTKMPVKRSIDRAVDEIRKKISE